MRKRLAAALTAGLLALTAAAVAMAATKSVTVGDNYYVKKSGVPTVTVKKNTTVKWVFKGKSPHNVVVKKGPAKFSSKVKSSGSYSKKVTRKGTYLIICTIHGQKDQSMKLKVT